MFRSSIRILHVMSYNKNDCSKIKFQAHYFIFDNQFFYPKKEKSVRCALFHVHITNLHYIT